MDLVIDHSVQVDVAGTPDALKRNGEIEFERNRERFEFLRWGQEAFANFRVVPPATGICHQVNLEFLAKVVMTRKQDGDVVAFPDTVVGTDSHTTMINGLGVLGWGVGGIEAEAAMLGQPLYMVAPPVVGVKIVGRLREGVTATDLALDRDPDPSEEGCGREVRGILRPRSQPVEPSQPGDACQHVAGIRGHDGFLPGGSGNPGIPAPDRASE